MKRFLVLASCLLLPAMVLAAGHARYRIDLRSGKQVFSRDLPVRRGSVLTFHREDDGKLMGLPAEDVLAIQSGPRSSRITTAADAVVRGRVSAIQTLAQPLQPGDIVVLGPTGSGSAQTQPGYGADLAGAGATPYTPPANNAYGGGYPFIPTGMTPAPGNTLSAQSGAPPTVGPNGFPVTSGNPPMIDSNGTPVLSPAPATEAAPAPVIGSNGTPVLSGTGQPVIGPNGTPILASPGTPGATPPSIGPNGTPVLAPAGSPGSTQPVIGPNGTPATPQPGTPASAQPATPPAQPNSSAAAKGPGKGN